MTNRDYGKGRDETSRQEDDAELQRRREEAESVGYRRHAQQHSGNGDLPDPELAAPEPSSDVDEADAEPRELTERGKRKLVTANDAAIKEQVKRRELAATLGVAWAWCSGCRQRREIHIAKGDITFTRTGSRQVRAPCPNCGQGLVQMISNMGASNVEVAAMDALRRAEEYRQYQRRGYMFRLSKKLKPDLWGVLVEIFDLSWPFIQKELDEMTPEEREAHSKINQPQPKNVEPPR